MARKNAEITFQKTYLPKVLNAQYPPKCYVRLEDMDIPENDCPELSERTAYAIDDASLQELFVSTQKNNLNLCVKFGLEHVFQRQKGTSLEAAFIIVLSKFPHYWIAKVNKHNNIEWASDFRSLITIGLTADSFIISSHNQQADKSVSNNVIFIVARSLILSQFVANRLRAISIYHRENPSMTNRK
ncbi:hypothetical protein F5887DRAFT_914499 [Amanita rubescens]|nr:hypothetical protein F5887DRAFT_914499 [Amanita rubescens]